MTRTGTWLKVPTLCAALLIGGFDISQAADDEITVWVSKAGPRWEAAVGVQTWPGLADLDVPGGGGFDSAGFNLSFAVHTPVHRIDRSELLAGVDLGFISNESDIPLTSDTLVARNAYITPSLKWMFGKHHRYSVDAGIGYYVMDMAEIAGSYPFYLETRVWEEGAIGGYLGGTFDFANANTDKFHGFSVNLKVHFVDFGRVSDELNVFPVALGQDAGSLSGPIYALQFGYRWR